MKHHNLKALDLLSESHSLAQDYINTYQWPWEIIPDIHNIIIDIGEHLSETEYYKINPHIWIHKTAQIHYSSQIIPPCIIGANTVIRQCAYLRGSTLIGANCVIGNSVEIKNSIVFDSANIAHFNYVGDSIIGYKAHLAGGVMISNLKLDHTNVCIHSDVDIQTNMRKCGAIVGDHVEIGANSVLNPGTVIGAYTRIYPLSCVRGVIQDHLIFKSNDVTLSISSFKNHKES